MRYFLPFEGPRHEGHLALAEPALMSNERGPVQKVFLIGICIKIAPVQKRPSQARIHPESIF